MMDESRKEEKHFPSYYVLTYNIFMLKILKKYPLTQILFLPHPHNFLLFLCWQARLWFWSDKTAKKGPSLPPSFFILLSFFGLVGQRRREKIEEVFLSLQTRLLPISFTSAHGCKRDHSNRATASCTVVLLLLFYSIFACSKICIVIVWCSKSFILNYNFWQASPEKQKRFLPFFVPYSFSSLCSSLFARLSSHTFFAPLSSWRRKKERKRE